MDTTAGLSEHRNPQSSCYLKSFNLKMLTPYLLHLSLNNLDNNYWELTVRIILSCLPLKYSLIRLKRAMTTYTIFKMSLLKILKM